MIAIVDYGVGNLHSIGKVLERFSEVRITRSALELMKAEKIVLPGVGAFPDAVSFLKTASIFNLLQELAKTKPILGLCLGMQLLFSESTEGGRTQGLDLIKGTVRRFEGEMKIPHIGWNTIEFASNPLLSGISNKSYFYFVHSYYADCLEDVVIARTSYSDFSFSSVVAKGNIFGCQFHPEKSSGLGLKLLENFAKKV
ncbi:MAG: imidazole glycerol phosphate synthase subunit HisH [bacterium]|nr:imidazole glycerol phosphate synthase subunit HisH [bacterium]